MRKTTSLIAVPVISASLLLTGCGGTTKTASTVAASVPSGASSATASATASAATSAASSAASACPTDNTQAFAKTRFVTNVGLAAGTFYQWIYKPYQAGKFAQGASGRTVTLIKAGLAGAFAAKQVKDATENVKADPTLCKIFVVPMTKLGDQLTVLKDKVTSGDLTAITDVAGQVGAITDLAQSNGLSIDTSKSGI